MAFPKRKASIISLPLFAEYPPQPPKRSLRQTLFLSFFGLLFTISLLINAFHFMSCQLDGVEKESIRQAIVTPSDNIEAGLLEKHFLPSPPHQQLQDLVLVAGHAIFVGSDLEHVEEDNDWVLEDYQKGGEQVKTFLKHIRKGVELTIDNGEALLIFSGGQTRPSAGPRSESQSYWVLAESLHMFPSFENSTVFNRATTEEYARDSYENLLFSICRFYELTGHYPRNVTVVGFGFKRRRFLELHRAAVKFPKERFNYVGIDPGDSALGRMGGENINGLGLFRDDLYGCHGKLRDKKINRNPSRRSHPYHLSCPSLSSLFNYCPDNQTLIFPGTLPWE
ncbi:10945_t:CDS:2 [Ambispora leptoticha]|uniref:10945_t:CDS:1 n=1 Tax=Ambispora leptoticha TaxID=144679 RepID=A0A9N8ZRC4_9GLOM|nr:10945_t:CDS:2 [Ambispora leptoticha]